MPKGIPLTEEELARRRREIFEAAVHLFVDKGFAETSLREIAEAAGVGKSTLYDYFASKDEILLSFFADELQGIAERSADVARQEWPATEKLRQVMRGHMEYLMAKKSLYWKLTFEAQRLALENQRRIQAMRHAYQDLLCTIIEEGIHSGEFRPVNPLLAVRGLLAMMTPAVYTSRPTGTPEEMLEEALDMFFKGVQA
ncbi:MAG: TetR family transcriptional regulator [Anaerolineales bacterium]|nr:TetR family transcriptional regulator [Anaerolineales bacterium]